MAEGAYDPPDGNSVAWCWNAPDEFTPVGTNGISNLTGRRNVDAGFSIVTYEGSTNDASTYTHGLNRTPEFVITKTRTAANEGWAVWQTSLGTGRLLRLHSSAEAGQNGSVWQDFDENVITIGDNTIVNGTGETYVSYIWHSVPGYSAFGSYQGNGEGGGSSPFVYLGFRPAFLMIKCSSAGTGGVHNWWIHDTTRAVNNPSTNPIAANVPQEEFDFGSALIDLNSNGFKLRGGPDQMNGNQTYVYCAFAENPFGSSNTSPANAR